MDPVIELRSEMRLKKRFRFDSWLIIGVAALGIFGLGLWLGERTASQPDISRRQAYAVAVEVMLKCDEMFVPGPLNLTGMNRKQQKMAVEAQQLANEKCQEVMKVAKESGYRVREKKK